MVQACDQRGPKQVEVIQNVIDLLTLDRAVVVAQLQDEPCEVLDRTACDQEGGEVDDIRQHLRARALDCGSPRARETTVGLNEVERRPSS